MKVLSKEKISFAKRLKEAMKNANLSQEKLASKIINPNTGNPISKNTVTDWLSGTPLTRNKKEILEQLSKILKVDSAFLECTQVEADKNEMFNEWNKIAKENNLSEKVCELEAFINYLKSIGISYDSNPINGTEEIISFIKDDYLYEIANIESCKTEISLSKGKIIKTISEEKFEAFMKEVNDFISFKFSQII